MEADKDVWVVQDVEVDGLEVVGGGDLAGGGDAVAFGGEAFDCALLGREVAVEERMEDGGVGGCGFFGGGAVADGFDLLDLVLFGELLMDGCRKRGESEFMSGAYPLIFVDAHHAWMGRSHHPVRQHCHDREQPPELLE